MNSIAARRRYQVYVWTIFAGGLTALLSLSGGMDGFGAVMNANSNLVLWATMILVAAMSPLPLPWGASTASLTPALDLAAILLFGPAIACWIAVLSRLVTNISQRWNPLLPGVLSIGQTVLAVRCRRVCVSVFRGRHGQ